MADEKKKVCFVVGPIGDPDSETRIHADWLLEEIILPVFKDFPGYDVVRADQIAQPGMIDAQIIRYLIDSDLVIADLSTLNPNAFYEIGVRHMVQKPIIHMQLVDDRIPFDVSLYRATKFSRARPSDLRKAREELKRSVSAIEAESYEVENPVTRARGQIKLVEHATPEQRVVIEQLQAIAERLDALEQFGPPPRARLVSVTPALVDTWYVHFDETKKDIKNVVYEALARSNQVYDANTYGSGVIEFKVAAGAFDSAAGKKLQMILMAVSGVQDVSQIPF